MCQPRPEDWFWRFVLSPRRQLTRQGVAPVARLRAPVASPLKANDLNQGLTNRFKPSMSSSMVVPPDSERAEFHRQIRCQFPSENCPRIEGASRKEPLRLSLVVD